MCDLDLQTALILDPNCRADVEEELKKLESDQKRDSQKKTRPKQLSGGRKTSDQSKGTVERDAGPLGTVVDQLDVAPIKAFSGEGDKRPWRSVSVEVLDSLPSEYAEYLPHKPVSTKTPTANASQPAKPPTTVAAATISDSPTTKGKQTSNPKPAKEEKQSPNSTHSLPYELKMQDIVISESFPTKFNVYELTHLLRRPQSEHAQVLAHLFYNFPSDKFPTIFGRGGIESNFIEAFLEAIEYACVSALKTIDVAMKKNIVLRSMKILDDMTRCARFPIAKAFASNKRMQDAFSALRGLASEERMEIDVRHSEDAWRSA